MAPKFSIAIPAYNRGEYLGPAIASCLVQTVTDLEVVVSDDCSIDDLESVALSFNDPRVRYSRSDVRLGAAKNHVRAVGLSAGSYIVNLHSDDMLLPDYLKVVGAALAGSPQAAAAYSSLALLTAGTISGAQPVPKVAFADHETFRANPWLEKHHNVAPTSCMFRRTAYELIGGYRESLRFAYDWDIYMRFMIRGGGVLFLPNVLAVYRQHEGQAARTVAHEGLFDVLDLWGREEFTRWQSWDIADLVITHLRAARKNAGEREAIIEHIRKNRLSMKLIQGGIRAVPRRLLRRYGLSKEGPDNNYREPDGIENATTLISALVSRG